MKRLKVVCFGPQAALEQIAQAVTHLNLGRWGNYDSWSALTPCTERFRPLAGSQPFQGQPGQLEATPSARLELQCESDEFGPLLALIKQLHPYETPAIEAWELFHPEQ